MLKKTIVILICLLVINTISSYSETYGIGDSLYGQYTDGKTIYTDKDIEQLANLGTSTIRALLVPTISLFGALQNTLQSPSANASTRNSALNTANLFHLVTSLIAPAIKLTTGREVINIDVQKLYDMIQSGQPLQLIDVRTPSEWEQIRISGTTNIPMQNVNTALKNETIKPNIPIIYICRTGPRAYMTALLTLTYNKFSHTPVYNLEGGTLAWVSEGLPTEGQSNKK